MDYLDGGRPWPVPCDAAFPCATQNELDEDDAKTLIDNGCQIVAEGANMPCSAAAVARFHDARILFGPAKAANAGGVVVSGLEMTQNNMRLAWTGQEVNTRLKTIMGTMHQTCLDVAERYGTPGSYIDGANIGGFVKVAEAMIDQGLV